jgi:hypothetical protein
MALKQEYNSNCNINTKFNFPLREFWMKINAIIKRSLFIVIGLIQNTFLYLLYIPLNLVSKNTLS